MTLRSEHLVQPGQPAPARSPIQGRSLWQDAIRRMQRNKAAMTSLIVLTLITLSCIFGPMISPHAFDTVYSNFVKVPASIVPYPRAGEVIPLVERTMKRARLQVESIELSGTTLRLAVTSPRSIDPRNTQYLDRLDILANARITEQSPDGLRAVMEADVVRQYFLFGTDQNGRDLFTRTLIAGRVSLLIGLLATAVALVIGVTYGATSGYLGGRADMFMMRFVDILYSLPFIFFVIMLVVFFGRNFVLMFIAVGAVEWLDMARIVRGQTLSIKRQEYVQAAEAMGVDNRGILLRHIIPNTLGPVVVYMTLMVPRVILLESFLSFLGLGVQEPMTSWGVLISEGARSIQGANWMLIFPAIFLVTTLLSLNFIGDGLRDALDPKDR